AGRILGIHRRVELLQLCENGRQDEHPRRQSNL
ncbi:MAG: hypothetical protein ACJAVY_000524, partial [Marinoscillum sp.]